MKNEKRMIDANRLIQDINADPYRTESEKSYVRCLVSRQPTIDAVEVVHGRWKKNWHDNNLIGHEYEYCSECGCIISDTEKFWDCNYCPNCGAKMDGERKDNG